MQWKRAERNHVVAGMPLSPDQLHRLMDYLDSNLKACDHTTRLTAIFLHVEHLEKDTVLSWLGEYGGYCDCEVLAWIPIAPHAPNKVVGNSWKNPWFCS